MPSPKQLTQETFTALKARVVTPFTPFESQMLDDRFRALQHFQPPQTYQAWLDATNVKGKMFGTKSRGDRLQAVDRAYKAWIEYAGEEGIVHWRNAENLASALEKYRGVVYNAGNQVSGLSHDYRSERDKGDVMSKTLSLCRLLQRLCVDSPVNSAQRRQRSRRALLILIANMKVEWDPKKALFLGTATQGYGAYSLDGDKEMTEKIIQALVYGVVPVGITAGVSYSAWAKKEKSEFQKSGSKLDAFKTAVGALPGQIKDAGKELPEKIWKFVTDKFQEFITWAKKTFDKNNFGIKNIVEILDKAGVAFAYLTKKFFTELAPFAKNGSQIYSSLRSLITDQWTVSNLSLQQVQLVTSDGPFAMIRKGIRTGIRNRQAVAGWSIATGALKIGAAITATEAAAKAANLLLSGFQLIFKILYNMLEIKRINGFIMEARTMWNHVQNAPEVLDAPVVGMVGNVLGPGVRQASPKPNFDPGTMPAFKAVNYTAPEFLGDRNAAYLNFLHSLVNTSPVMAAIVMNSNEFTGVDEALHAATPRSTEDVKLAAEHIELLKIEAKRLYQESGFKVTPHNRSELGAADTALFYNRITAAQLNEAVLAVAE